MEHIDKSAICELSELLHSNNLREIEYEAENVRIRVVANYEEKALPAVNVATPVVDTVKPETSTPAYEVKNAVKSPMVGIVYLSADPSSDPFVREGDMVGVGQTLCLIEAMKTFNPVKAEKKGTIKKVLVQSGMPVEFGEHLFVIE